jgi:hypothetical protein
VLPASTYGGSPYADVNDVQLETIGWPEYADQVRAVLDGLPPQQRRTAVVMTSNYGEAGALSWYDVGAPTYSGHNGYRFWGPPPESARPVVVVGRLDPTRAFDGCSRAATLHNDAGVPNEEEGAPVWLCDSVRGSWARQWPGLGHYDA